MSAKNLTPINLSNVGVFGLNTQSNAGSLPPEWLTKADNIVLDTSGRITTRQGIKQYSETIGSNSSNSDIVRSITEYRKADGTYEMFCGANDKIYKFDESTTPWQLDAQVFGGTPQTITDGNWQFTNFNNQLYGVQRGFKMINYDGTTWKDIDDVTGYAGDAPQGNCVLGEFGRLWVGGVDEQRDVVYYSDTLQGHIWNNVGFCSLGALYPTETECTNAEGTWTDVGSQGTIDLKTVWGADEIIALANFGGKLVIFGRHNIALYNNPWDPVNMALDEVIEGIGCIARDSVAHVGDDVIFLSNSGLRSLSRTALQDKLPLTDLSRNVRDDLVAILEWYKGSSGNSNTNNIKGEYSLSEGFYLLSIPDAGVDPIGGVVDGNAVYMFDFKIPNQDGTPRVTCFSLADTKALTALYSRQNTNMYIGLGSTDYAGRVGKLEGYFDQEIEDTTSTYGTSGACSTAGGTWQNSKCWITTENTYNATTRTTWLDFGNPSIAKLLKRAFLSIYGGRNGTAELRWYRDYNDNMVGTTGSFSTTPMNAGGGTVVYKYGSGTYSNAQFLVAVSDIMEFKKSLGMSGKVLQFELTQKIKGYKASLQNLNIIAKIGKIR